MGLPSTPALCEKLNKEFPVPNGDVTIVVEPTAKHDDEVAEKVQHSALSYRQSYFQDMPLPPPKPLFPSRKDDFRENRPKSSVSASSRTRHIRLRPRQVLCSRCQGKCGQSKSTSGSTKNSSKSDIGNKARTLLKKRKMVGDSSLDNVPNNKKIKLKNNNKTTTATNGQPRRSPIIKISYATPQGKGHVMRIPARSQTGKNGSHKASSTQQNGNGGGKHRPTTTTTTTTTTNGKNKNIKTAQKVLKNAKTKAQQSAASRSKPKIKIAMFNGFHPKSSSVDGKPKKIRIIKSSKGTYHSTTAQDTSSLANGKIATVNMNNNITKNDSSSNNKKSIGKVTAVATKLHITSNSPNSKQNIRKQKFENNKVASGSVNGKVMNGLALPPHIPMKNSGYDSSSECSNQSTGSRGSRGTKRAVSTSGDDSDNPIIIGESQQQLDRKKVPPLNLRIHKKNVTRSALPDGRVMCIGDVVWGKIIGFPWWPGRINEISISRRDNGLVLEQEAQITWFAAKTLSYMPVSKLYPFLKCFNARYDRKKRGVYKEAVRLATEAASAMSSEVRALNTMFETSQLQP